MDKFVKLDAIEKMAQPMSAFHGMDKTAMPEEPREMEEELCECPKCGHTFKKMRPVMEEEESEEYEDEEYED